MEAGWLEFINTDIHFTPLNSHENYEKIEQDHNMENVPQIINLQVFVFAIKLKSYSITYTLVNRYKFSSKIITYCV